jgi:hypothetical protein
MAQDAAKGQGLHAALIRQGPIPIALQHLPSFKAEMLQEIRAGDVDLGRDRP